MGEWTIKDYGLLRIVPACGSTRVKALEIIAHVSRNTHDLDLAGEQQKQRGMELLENKKTLDKKPRV